MKWIKCSERLPEKRQDVFIYIHDLVPHSIFNAYWDERTLFDGTIEKGWWVNSYCCRQPEFAIDLVTYWMPIPNRPEKPE